MGINTKTCLDSYFSHEVHYRYTLQNITHRHKLSATCLSATDAKAAYEFFSGEFKCYYIFPGSEVAYLNLESSHTLHLLCVCIVDIVLSSLGLYFVFLWVLDNREINSQQS